MKTIILFSTLAVLGFGTYAQKTQKDSATNYINLWIKQNTERAITGTIMNAALNKIQRGIIDTAYYSGDSLYIVQNGAARFLRRDSWKKTGNYVSNTNAANVGINTTAPDSALSVMGGILGTGGVRLTGLPSAAGTKALRYDPATGNISYADTSAGGGGGGGTPTIQQALTAGATLTTSNNIINGNNELKISGLNGSYSSRINDQITLSLDSTKTETPLITVMPHKWHPDHTNFFFNVIGSNQFPYQGKNNVATFGWNIGPGGGAVKAGRPGIGYSMESNYHPDSDSGATWVESHEFYLKPNGTQVRLKSYTIGAIGAQFVNLYHTTDVFSTRDDITGLDYFSVNKNRTNASVGLSLVSKNSSLNFFADSTNSKEFYISTPTSAGTINYQNNYRVLFPGGEFQRDNGTGPFGSGVAGIISDRYVTSAANTGFIGTRSFHPAEIYGRNYYSDRLVVGDPVQWGYFNVFPAQYNDADLVLVGEDTDNTKPLLYMQTGSYSGYTLKVMNGGAVYIDPAKLPTYADDAAAAAGGITAGRVYKSSDGIIRIKL